MCSFLVRRSQSSQQKCYVARTRVSVDTGRGLWVYHYVDGIGCLLISMNRNSLYADMHQSKLIEEHFFAVKQRQIVSVFQDLLETESFVFFLWYMFFQLAYD